MIRTLYYTLLGALMATSWGHRPTASAWLATALLVVMIARTVQLRINRPRS